MQIISGIYKNSKILSPLDSRTHPMGSREKLALFNSLTSVLPNNSFAGLSVLDVFAGTGALGLEALSRGAKNVIFVEKSREIVKILVKNIKNILKDAEKIKKETNILIKDANSLDFAPDFDLIFADPPYDLYNEAMIAPLRAFIKISGILAISMPSDAPTPIWEGFRAISRREYAHASILILQKIA